MASVRAASAVGAICGDIFGGEFGWSKVDLVSGGRSGEGCAGGETISAEELRDSGGEKHYQRADCGDGRRFGDGRGGWKDRRLVGRLEEPGEFRCCVDAQRRSTRS